MDLATPARLEEALALVGAGYRPLAGATDVMVLLAAGKLAQPADRRWVDLTGIDALRGIEARPEALILGALTTYTELRENGVVAREFPNLVAAARETGGIAVQNRGTLGGNIGNASPAADALPALLAYGAELELLSTSGSRRIPYDAFHLGYKRTAASPGEIVARIHLPRGKPRQDYYRKVGPRQAQAISKVCMAASALKDGARVVEVRIAFGGVAPVPLRCHEVERALVNGDTRASLSSLARAIAPIDDIRSTARYRRRVAENLLRDFMLLLGCDVELGG
jgi:CO/xanthine dehydrogenase FAD-binding subunit